MGQILDYLAVLAEIFEKLRNLHIPVSKFDFTNLRKYLTPESAGGRIFNFCMSGNHCESKTLPVLFKHLY